MTSGSFGGDLIAGPPPTHLPADPADAELAGGDAPAAVVRRHPDSPAAWAALAQQAQDAGADDVTVYAYARVGYHRSLDRLRRNGWKGHGPVPWEHEPNRGFLRCARAPRPRRPGDRRDRRVGAVLDLPPRLQPGRGRRAAGLTPDRSARQTDRWSRHPGGGVTVVTARVVSRG